MYEKTYVSHKDASLYSLFMFMLLITQLFLTDHFLSRAYLTNTLYIFENLESIFTIFFNRNKMRFSTGFGYFDFEHITDTAMRGHAYPEERLGTRFTNN